MKKLIFYIFLAILGLFIFGVFQYDIGQTNKGIKINVKEESVSKDDVNKEKSNKLEAYNLMTYEVIKLLKEPSTAEFPNSKQKLKHIEILKNKSYRIKSWVDSRDTYGAMTRKNFSCIFKINGPKVIYERLIIDEVGYILKDR